ncbi:MAG TPA: UDPGP type 1 family protein [Phycisphaerales bacterium]|nr:UDPGP type 1 family protein [Phycisphaerales bacterium]
MPDHDEKLARVKRRLEAAGQSHALTFYDRLDNVARRALVDQIDALNLEALPGLVEKYVRSKPSFAPAGEIQPAPYYPKDEGSPTRPWDRAAMKRAGEEIVRAGKVAAFTVAGGQGTRLGYDGPKGQFPGGAVTKKPLFQCLAEWIIAASKKYGVTIPWYIMTSPLNHEATRVFLAANNFFGMSEKDVMLFPQGEMPSFDLRTGKMLLAEPGVVATNPDGHGGSLLALARSGAIADMRRRGVEHISYVQIDNPLARVIDPVFIGLHARAPDSSGEMSSKMVAKSDPAERVGVFARVGGKTCVVEYSDLPKEMAEARHADHRLKFNAGSIAIHVIGVSFVQRLNEVENAGGGGFALDFHRAEKKVPYIDLEDGRRIEPMQPNAVKLEAFVFDALALCKSSIVYETDRVEEFAPIKNAEGADSPATCREIQTVRAARWLGMSGVEVPRDESGKPVCTLEISPMTAMEPEDLRGVKLPKVIEKGAAVAI